MPQTYRKTILVESFTCMRLRRKQYEVKLSELEKERETIEEEKAQVDRYKQLLLKQRDIMIALTQRLNERDEQITALQDELDAYSPNASPFHSGVFCPDLHLPPPPPPAAAQIRQA
jgi:hypothetical protein